MMSRNAFFSVTLLLVASLHGDSLAAPGRMAPSDCPAGCDDRNPCTDDVCDPIRGCLHVPNAAPCSDGNPCTTADTCQWGACVGGPPSSVCSPCQANAALPPSGGTFTGVTSGSSRTYGTGDCRRTGSAPERVYRWTPSVSGRAEIFTCGSSTAFDTVLYVRRGSCSGGQYACNDNGPCQAATNAQAGSRIVMDVVAGQTYFLFVDGYNGARGRFSLTVRPPSVCGDGIRQGDEECDLADASACATGMCETDCTCVRARCGDGIRQSGEQCDLGDASACASGACYPDCTCIPDSGGNPDLVPEIVTPYLQFATSVPSGDVLEGCAARTTGVDLLRFGVLVRNLGRTDLFLGAPACPEPCEDHPGETCGNPLFICAPAGGHNHGHYQNYADYELLSADGAVRAAGHKQGFCLHDGFDSGVPCPNRHFDSCDYQGLSVGCGDLYEATLGCQYVEVTGLPSGPYTLRVTVDPLGQIPEDDEGNNVVTVPVSIPDRSCPVTPIPSQGGVFQGVTSGADALASTCGSGATGPEKVYRWVPTRSGIATVETCGSGTDFDTVVHVRTGSCFGREVVCNDDGPCAISNSGEQGSRTSFPVEAGASYFIIVDGYAGGSGRFTLKVTAP